MNEISHQLTTYFLRLCKRVKEEVSEKLHPQHSYIRKTNPLEISGRDMMETERKTWKMRKIYSPNDILKMVGSSYVCVK